MVDINADFSKRVVAHGASMPWIESPIKGVNRRMLDRIGDEVARATSLVKYDKDSQFSPHVHAGGEEFMVLEGVFQDEHGDFPAGSYVRNPPTSRHTPRSDSGCVIFVKLQQFDPVDRIHIKTQTNNLTYVCDPNRTGVSISSLFEDSREYVRIEQWLPEIDVHLDSPGGVELLVLSGNLQEAGDTLSRYSWLRIPIGGSLHATSGPNGAKVWIKSGHLRYLTSPV